MLYLAMLETEEERRSFASFYQRFQGKCLAVARAITHNAAWAEEAVSEAFLKMIRHNKRYFSDPQKRTGAQIMVMVKCAAIDILRREKRLQHGLLDEGESTFSDEMPDAFRILAGKETVERLTHHVSKLDGVDRALFEMKYLSDLSNGEMAVLTGISKNAVAIRIHKMTKKLFILLKNEGYIDG